LPDEKSNWINLTSKRLRYADSHWQVRKQNEQRLPAKEKAVFKLYSLGVSTNRDDWVTDFDRHSLNSEVANF